MALAVDTTSNDIILSGDTSSFAHTCTGSDLILVIVVTRATGESVNSAKYNGVSATSRVTVANAANKVDIFTLDNPATGSNTVEVILSGSSAKFMVSVVSLTGRNLTDSTGATNTKTGTAQPKTIDLTTTTDGAFVVDGLTAGGGVHTVGAGQTTIGLSANLASSYEAGGASPATTTMSWASTISQVYGSAVLEISGDTVVVVGGGGEMNLNTKFWGAN